MDMTARQDRTRRAVQQVIARYTITPGPPLEGRLVFSLHGGSAVWRVEVDPTAATLPTCTCPDFVHRGAIGDHACKHVLAVLFGQPELRAQALDYFL